VVNAVLDGEDVRAEVAGRLPEHLDLVRRAAGHVHRRGVAQLQVGIVHHGDGEELSRFEGLHRGADHARVGDANGRDRRRRKPGQQTL
jgi:hypothetical protein